MAMSLGGFVWHELMTADVAAAEAFYGHVLRWSVADAGMPGMHYSLAKIGERSVAGLMGFPPGMTDPRPAWFVYILVDDVDSMAGRVAAAGGAVHRPPMDIPGVGRFAVVSDPQGAVFMLFRGDGTAPPDMPRDTPGDIGWHELMTETGADAFGFYERLFGWEKAYAHDMGPMGVYQTFNAGGVWAGGMMGGAPASEATWRFYFNVDDIDAAAARVLEGGGTIDRQPQEVPGGNWVFRATDPQGTSFSLTGPRR